MNEAKKFKRLEDYTQEELANFDDQQINDLIDLEVAFAGILEIQPPTIEKPKKSVPDSKLARVVYSINGTFFDSYEDATKVLEFNPFGIDYQSAVGYNYKYKNDSPFSISKESLYSKEEIYRCKKENERLCEQLSIYESQEKEYNDYLSAKSEVVERISSTIYAAKKFLSKCTQILDLYKKYLTLTKSEEIALTLIKDNCTDQEVLNYVSAKIILLNLYENQNDNSNS